MELITKEGFKLILPADSYTRAEEYVKKGKFKIIKFETKDPDDDFKECYYEERMTPEGNKVVYIWPTIWGFYGFRDGWMFFGSFVEDAIKEVQEYLNKKQ